MTIKRVKQAPNFYYDGLAGDDWSTTVPAPGTLRHFTDTQAWSEWDGAAWNAFTSASGGGTAGGATAARQDTGNASLATIASGVAGVASEAHTGQVTLPLVRKRATITRPNNATPYAAGQIITDTGGVLLAISGCARSNGLSGNIRRAMVIDSANQAVLPTLELWVFSTKPADAADGTAIAFTDTELLELVAIIPLPNVFVGIATAGAGGNAVYYSDPTDWDFTCAGGSTSLYTVPVVRNAYTPVANETLTPILSIVQG